MNELQSHDNTPPSSYPYNSTKKRRIDTTYLRDFALTIFSHSDFFQLLPFKEKRRLRLDFPLERHLHILKKGAKKYDQRWIDVQLKVLSHVWWNKPVKTVASRFKEMSLDLANDSILELRNALDKEKDDIELMTDMLQQEIILYIMRHLESIAMPHNLLELLSDREYTKDCANEFAQWTKDLSRFPYIQIMKQIKISNARIFCIPNIASLWFEKIEFNCLTAIEIDISNSAALKEVALKSIHSISEIKAENTRLNKMSINGCGVDFETVLKVHTNYLFMKRCYTVTDAVHVHFSQNPAGTKLTEELKQIVLEKNKLYAKFRYAHILAFKLRIVTDPYPFETEPYPLDTTTPQYVKVLDFHGAFKEGEKFPDLQKFTEAVILETRGCTSLPQKYQQFTKTKLETQKLIQKIHQYVTTGTNTTA